MWPQQAQLRQKRVHARQKLKTSRHRSMQKGLVTPWPEARELAKLLKAKTAV
jgi:hypothetical protein